MMNKSRYEPFIRNDQYNFIRFQLRNLTNANATTKDPEVLHALRYNSLEKIHSLFSVLTEEQKGLLNRVVFITEDIQANTYLAELKPYVHSFKKVTEHTITQLFPKAKKLKVPFLDQINFSELSYLGWYDIRSERKYIIFDYKGNLVGIQGTFMESKKGICTLCNRQEQIGLFMTNVKKGIETYTNRGNYICKDSQKCNQNIMKLDKLNQFFERIKEKN